MASTLILLSFDDGDHAREAFDKIQDLHQVALLRLTGSALIAIGKDGHVELTTAAHDPTAPIDLAPSAAFGLILGSLVTTPLFGFAVGGTLNAVFQKHEETDNSLDQKFREEISKALKAGSWAVAVYASEVAQGEVGRQLEPFQGTVYSVDLSDDDESSLAGEVGVKV